MIDLKAFIACLRDYVDRALMPITDRPTMRWAGPHTAGVRYRAGAVVQRSGALFVALARTQESPGKSSAWRRIAGSKE